MQARGGTLPPGILFDSDMGRNIDAALALAMLHGLGRGRLIAVGISNSNLDAAAFTDALGRFYGTGGVLPIGLAEDGPKLENAPMLSVPLGMRNPDGQPAFRRGIRDIIDTADPAVIFRNGLLTQQDQQAIVILAGPATNLTRTLMLPRAREIVAAKVRLLVMAAGDFGAGAATDSRITSDVASARKLLADWPSPIVAVGLEAANAAPFPASAIENDFAALPNHPVIPAYRAYRESSSNQVAGVPAPAVLAVLYASNPAAEYFKLSQPGAIEVMTDGRTRFTESPRGNHRLLLLDPAEKESVTQAFVALATARPPTGRGAPPRE